jgi:hypothetical protein
MSGLWVRRHGDWSRRAWVAAGWRAGLKKCWTHRCPLGEDDGDICVNEVSALIACRERDVVAIDLASGEQRWRASKVRDPHPPRAGGFFLTGDQLVVYAGTDELPEDWFSRMEAGEEFPEPATHWNRLRVSDGSCAPLTCCPTLLSFAGQMESKGFLVYGVPDPDDPEHRAAGWTDLVQAVDWVVKDFSPTASTDTVAYGCLGKDRDGLACYDLAKGRLAWKVALGREPRILGGDRRHVFLNARPDDVTLTVAAHGARGACEWSFTGDGCRLDRVDAVTFDDTAVLFTAHDFHQVRLFCVERADGRERWSDGADLGMSEPVLGNDGTVVCKVQEQQGRRRRTVLRCWEVASGRRQWDLPVSGSPWMHRVTGGSGSLLVLQDDHLVCYRPRAG